MKTYLNSTFASLGTRNYRLYFMGQVVSVIGNWMQKLAQAWLVLELTGGSGTWLGIVVAVQQLPTLLLSPWGGVLADRYQKRRLLLCAASAGVVPAGVLCVLSFTDLITIPVVLMVALMTGVVDSLEKPSRHAFPSEMVRPELVTNAVTLNNVIQDSGKAIGPAVAALLIASVGLPYTFMINSVSYLGVLLALLLMNPAELDSPKPARRHRGQLRDGLRYVRRTPHLLGPVFLLTAAGLLAYNFQVLLPVLGTQVFGGGAATVGYLLATLGLGSVVGGLALAGILSPTLGRMISAAAVLSVCLLLLAASPTLTVSLVLVFLTGAASVVFKTLASSWLQLTAEPMMRGRVLSLLVIAIAGTSPVGAPLAGWLSEHLGIRPTLVIAGLATATAAAVTHVYLRRHARRIDGPPFDGARARRWWRPRGATIRSPMVPRAVDDTREPTVR